MATTSLQKSLNEVLAYAQGTQQAARVTPIIPNDVNVGYIRKHLHLSQQEFADRYGFPVGTVRNWEQGRRRPEGAARLLLRLIESQPELVNEVLRHTVKAA